MTATAYGRTAPVLGEALFGAGEGAALWAKRAALVAAGVFVLAAASKLRIPLAPVPVTMQTFAVLAVGAAYGPRLGLATVALWLALGAAGANVFAGAEQTGLAYMSGATGGYLAGFALAAAALGFLARRGWDRSPATMAGAMAIGNALIYAPGLLWLGKVYGFDAPVLDWGLYPFLAGDALKLAAAAIIFPAAWRFVGDARG